MKTLFLAWLDPNSRSWFPIGRLTFDGANYQFVYTQAAKEAQEKCGFQPLSSFPHLDEVYKSTHLFSVFSNRLMPRSRPDYSSFIQWLNLPQHENDPIAILARSGGQRETDTLTVFPKPEPDEEGRFQIHFFARGLRYLPTSAIERINRFSPGEKLWLAQDFQNTIDSPVLTINTEERYIVGYCPQYLNSEILALLLRNPSEVEVRVLRVNQPPTPLQFRLLCQLTALWSDENRLFSSAQYQPLIAEVAAAIS
ncbi:DNA-binding protein [[Phormidium ambiguum] IAM M-71]|uniref:DNA-binding protein n=1 Tax=[Phormidium ambiguum] IAM M-71 TaxID=454136 RepID=A0A1U7I6J2_9CYAN|nr:HIRAN domain-containing protein [Phormidium ambiguum]OKH31948.1 DNA-binding protein [Phormidium ambiguum IAM M-71]